MSGLFATIAAADGVYDVDSAWERVRAFGGEDAECLRLSGAALGVARRPWQRTHDLAGHALIVRDGPLVVLTDATLYARRALLDRLEAAGERVAGSDPGYLIAAGWRAWGPRLVDHLIGDYAFVVWDADRVTLCAARDPMGSRPLFYTPLREGVGVASSSRALALLRGSEGDFNLRCLGAQVAGTLLAMGTDTAYSGVDHLRPGFRLLWENGTCRVERFWRPPEAPDRRPGSIDDAAAEFRDLLRRVVRDRMGTGANSVWMSGGWDSTAVFGAGSSALEVEPDAGASLRPVSIRYPEDDPGYEDPWITATAARWGTDVEWIESEEIPLLDALVQRAGRADEPPAHLYERWNVALARGSRRLGAHIALDGCGGDNLFQVSDVVMADELRRGRVDRAARIARARRSLGWRYFVRHALIPLVPSGVLRGLSSVSSVNVPLHYMELGRAHWVPDSFVRREGLRERDLAVLREMTGDSLAQSENMAFVMLPALAWGGSYMRGVLLEEGVEARSPLLDPRVIDFALRRPVADRVSEAETKMLLRMAVKGWVPDDVLAPRPYRTGTTSGYSTRQMRAAYPALLDRLFAEPLRVADLGIVDPGVLREAADEWRTGRGDHFRTELFNTMRVEFWLRGRDHG